MRSRVVAILLLASAGLSAQNLSISMTGDIMMGTTVPGNYLPANDGKNLFKEVASTLTSTDLTIGNLEGTLCDTPGSPRPMTNPKTYFLFKMPQKYVQNLVDAGFDAMNIATNHINDFGQEGRDSTMSTLKAAKLAFSGLKDACDYTIVVRNNKKIGICSFCDSNNSVDINDVPGAVSIVRKLRPFCDYVIVTFHGGGEGAAYQHVTRKVEYYVGEKRGNVYELAHACIDAGADLVFGHGPHVPRALELYHDHLIAYSLGNFCTPYRISVSGICGYAPILVASIDHDGRFVEGRIESYIQKVGVGPVKDPTHKAALLMKSLSKQDFPESRLVITDDGRLLTPDAAEVAEH
ncbi:MAG: CapA family protein [Bacteroidales bacterium]|nr:CapA family protein [Bacteroidales bacterium]